MTIQTATLPRVGIILNTDQYTDAVKVWIDGQAVLWTGPTLKWALQHGYKLTVTL